MNIFKQTFRALATVGVLVLGVLGILTVLEVITLKQLTEPLLKSILVLGVVGVMTLAIAILQRSK